MPEINAKIRNKISDVFVTISALLLFCTFLAIAIKTELGINIVKSLNEITAVIKSSHILQELLKMVLVILGILSSCILIVKVVNISKPRIAGKTKLTNKPLKPALKITYKKNIVLESFDVMIN